MELVDELVLIVSNYAVPVEIVQGKEGFDSVGSRSFRDFCRIGEEGSIYCARRKRILH